MNEKQKLKVGITGQSGFIGSHLFNYLGIHKDDIERIEFRDEYFYNGMLPKIISGCDVIIHLAAINRHPDQKVLFETNLNLIRNLLIASESVNHFPHIIFSSSTQEEKDNPYGRSKYDGRKLFEDWAEKHNSVFSGVIIPNVFGPFGKPFYNSVVATFCYQLTYNVCPEIDNDIVMKLIYVTDLSEFIYNILNENKSNTYYVKHSAEIKVSAILKLLEYFKETYLVNNIVPCLSNNFEIALFNTFRSFIDSDRYKVNLLKRSDQRGYLTENIKEYTGGQSFFSVTLPGITRGNHFHTRKIERFCVVQGEGIIRLRKIGSKEIIEIPVSGDEPAAVDIPVWYTHNITNTGKDNMLTLFWTNEIFNPGDTDTFFEEV